MLKVKLLHPDAKPPEQAMPNDSGYDLFAVDETILWPFFPKQIKTGIAVEYVSENRRLTNSENLTAVEDISGRIDIQLRGRSGLAKKGVYCFAGTVEEDYRGEVKAVLTAFRLWPYRIRKGDRIGQLVLGWQLPSQEVEVADTLSTTVRGEKGFSSTGR